MTNGVESADFSAEVKDSRRGAAAGLCRGGRGLDAEGRTEGSCRRQEIDHVFDGFVGAVVGAFEATVRPVLRIGAVA
jgi:hypothetical protein